MNINPEVEKTIANMNFHWDHLKLFLTLLNCTFEKDKLALCMLTATLSRFHLLKSYTNRFSVRIIAFRFPRETRAAVKRLYTFPLLDIRTYIVTNI